MIFCNGSCYRLVFIFLAVFYIALNHSSAQIYVGAKAGLQYSWVNFQNDSDKDFLSVDPVFGYNAGVLFAFSVKKRFFLQTELLYSTKGRTFEGVLDESLENTARFKYLEMPIIYKVDFKGLTKSGRVFKWFVGAGPLISYWLGGSGTLKLNDLEEIGLSELDYTYKFGDIPNNPAQDIIYISDPNRFQLGLVLSTGVFLEATDRSSFSIDLRYEFGHSFLAPNQVGIIPDLIGFSDPLEVRNAGFRLSVAYLFDTKYEQRKKGKSTIKYK